MAEEQARSLSETNNWEHVDKDLVHQDWDVLYKELAACVEGSLPEDERIQELVGRHFEIICRFYVPTREAYIGIGLHYEADEAMRGFHNSYHPRMVEFLGEAIKVYADQGAGFAS
ncbi:TipAS antibiotic-recognition domain-containing protein [Kitasatospora sp. NPDC091207]|uniref:TipAS antibiotic-recognition domain-containing protein n=1 Tax=Kitasatospora sp. NPDC091207 TaxID=3364083 RepID=UPI00381B5C21